MFEGILDRYFINRMLEGIIDRYFINRMLGAIRQTLNRTCIDRTWETLLKDRHLDISLIRHRESI